MQFYTNPTVIKYFKNYIQHLLTHVNPYTGLTYAQDPTIIGYETGNEMNGLKFGDKDVPVAWTREICQYVKSLGPRKLCIDGTYGVNTTHFTIEEVDIFSDHYYPLNTTILQEDITAVASTNRVYLAGEIDWTGLNGKTTPQGSTLQSFYDVILARQNTSSPVVAGSLFWSLFMHDVPDCSVSLSTYPFLLTCHYKLRSLRFEQCLITFRYTLTTRMASQCNTVTQPTAHISTGKSVLCGNTILPCKISR